jgi:hypothetical protein
MAKIDDLIRKMKENPGNVRFNDLSRVCEFYFGVPRHSGSCHHVYKTPWQGDPRVNIQNKKGKAKPYQVRQVLIAMERLQEQNNAEE